MKTVIVAEKKSVAEDLVKALLNGRAETHDGFYSSGELAITYCSGHLVGLAEPDEYPGKIGRLGNSVTYHSFRKVWSFFVSRSARERQSS